MKIAICGPNLNDQSKGQFHVHSEDCGDLKHYGRNGKFGGETPWIVDVESKYGASLEIYADHLSDHGLTAEDAGAREMIRDWMSDLHFLPCTKTLPVETGSEV